MLTWVTLSSSLTSLYGGRDLVTGMMRAFAPASSAFFFPFGIQWPRIREILAAFCNIVIFVASVRHLKKTAVRVVRLNFNMEMRLVQIPQAIAFLNFPASIWKLSSNKTRHVQSFHPSPR
jgi:hypothetical protein